LVTARGVPQPDVEDSDLQAGGRAAMLAVSPYKVLEKQRTCMRRSMRKPQTMTTRAYVNHLIRINEQEIVHLPPFNGTSQAFSNDELKEIILYGLPNSWRKEMDKFDFNVYDMLGIN
jgi:hypothetical protein